MGLTRPVVLLIYLLCGAPVLFGQPQARIDFGIGPSVINERIDSLRSYDLWLLSGGVSRMLTRPGNKINVHGGIDFEFGTVRLSRNEREVDMSITLSASLIWHVHPHVGVMLEAGSGPGYQSSETGKQAKGFVFSNHVGLGLEIPLFGSGVVFRPQYRFRHMSNARLKRPNSGIDSFFAIFALEVPLRRPSPPVL